MSIEIGKIDGIPIRLHFTLVIAFFLIAWSLASSFMPEYMPGLSQIQYWIMGGFGAVVLFVSVLIHELAHSKLAMRYGVKIQRIVLFLFGGVSDISEELMDYKKEAKMAIAGPLTSFALAGVFAGALFALGAIGIGTGDPWHKMMQGILYYAVLINIVLGVFNMLPAFPSDGGRVLRALLVRKKKDFLKATQTAVKVGIAISYGFIAFGFIELIGGSFVSGIWIILIGWFLMTGAQSYMSQLQVSTALSSVRIRDIMNTNVIAVKDGIAADELLLRYFQTYQKSGFPVIDDRGRLLGMVTLRRVQDVPDYNRAAVTAADLMIPLHDLPVMDPGTPADIALNKMAQTKIGKIFVCNNDGVLVGLVSKTDILGVEMERDEFAHELRM